MKLSWGLFSTTWMGAIALLAVQSALAAEPLTENLSEAEIESREAVPRNLDGAAVIIDEWPTQVAQTEAIAITNIQIDATTEGLTLQLETNGELPAPETATTGNAVTADIPNAVLQLPEGEDFLVTEPIAGIALVNVTDLPNNQVRIAITGTDAPPIVDISSGVAGFTVSATLGVPTAQTPDADSIQIVVTGETENDYFVPNGSTATRTATPLLDIPQAIQVVPQQVLEDQQILRVDDALRNVSGVVGRLDAFTPITNLTIRGFSIDTLSNGAILRDGFRITNNLSSQETANIERIEVIKGPSSVLYGQTDPGGLINLVTKRPLSEPFYDLGVQVGNVGLIRPSIDLTGPLTEDGRLVYRLNAAVQHEESFRGFETDTSRSFIAPVLSWDISDRTNLTVLLEYLEEEFPFDNGLPVIGNSVIDVPRDRIQGEPYNRTQSDSLTLGYDLTHQFNDNWTLNHNFRYVTQDYRVLPSALAVGVDETTGEATRFFGDREYHSDDYTLQTNVVGEFNTGSIQHTLLAGVDINFNRFDERFTRLDLANPSQLNIFNPVYGRPPSDLSNETPLTPIDRELDQYGVFLQDQITLSEQFIVVGSLRYDSVDLRDPNTSANNRSDEAWSPRIGFVYQPTESLSLYANYSQSFTPNTGSTFDGDPLEPERASGFEVGAKAELLEGNLFATLAYFDITKRNVSTADPDNLFFNVATGEQRSQGIELDIAGEILPGWNIIANYAYTDARITEDNTNPEGNRLFNSPRHSASLWTTYEIQTGSLEGLGVGLGINYVGRRFGDLANSFEVDDYLLTNAALFYERENWRLGLNFNNLFDVDYISSTNNSRRTSNSPGAPFSVIGSVSIQF